MLQRDALALALLALGACAGDGIAPEVVPSECVPRCAGRHCGDDGCQGTCGSCGAEAPFCVAGSCVAQCTPTCDGRDCGPDGCGDTCGTCQASARCVDGTCCVATCAGRACGDDGCGGPCGVCEQSQACVSGACVAGAAPNRWDEASWDENVWGP